MTSSELSSLVLWRAGQQTFWVTVAGNYVPLLANGNYIVIDNKYESIFVHLWEQLKLENITIIDRVEKTELHNYKELKIFNQITPETIYKEKDEGFKIWSYSGNVFVSELLKNELCSFSDNAFSFSLGFSEFG